MSWHRRATTWLERSWLTERLAQAALALPFMAGGMPTLRRCGYPATEKPARRPRSKCKWPRRNRGRPVPSRGTAAFRRGAPPRGSRRHPPVSVLGPGVFRRPSGRSGRRGPHPCGWEGGCLCSVCVLSQRLAVSVQREPKSGSRGCRSRSVRRGSVHPSVRARRNGFPSSRVHHNVQSSGRVRVRHSVHPSVRDNVHRSDRGHPNVHGRRGGGHGRLLERWTWRTDSDQPPHRSRPPFSSHS